MRYKALQHRRTKLQAGIGIYLDKPRLEILVYHEVQSEQLEILVSVFTVQGQPSCTYSQSSYFSHLRYKYVVEV